MRSDAYMQIGEYKEARKDANDLIALKPTKPDGYIRKAYSYLGEMKISDAMLIFDKA